MRIVPVADRQSPIFRMDVFGFLAESQAEADTRPASNVLRDGLRERVETKLDSMDPAGFAECKDKVNTHVDRRCS